jgi:SurA N-terminal domain
MSAHSPKLGVAVALVLLVATAFPAEVIDRIVATVNGAPLLQSDLEDSIHMEAFLQQRTLPSVTQGERSAALGRMIDQELLRQQMQGEFAISDSDIDAQIAAVRAQCNVAGSDAAWKALLAGYALDEPLLREHLAARLTAMRFVDLRLRSTVHIDRDAVEAYYRETLVPKLQQMNAKIDPLSDVAPKIEELLAQQRMDELLNAWLANLRSQSTIHLSSEVQQSARAEMPSSPPSPMHPIPGGK